MDVAEKPDQCPCCRRPIAPEESRCRSCGTDLTESALDHACEWGQAFDEDEDWEEDLSPDRVFVIFVRVVAGLAAAGATVLFAWMAFRAQGIGDWIVLIVLGLIVGAWLMRILKMAYVEARLTRSDTGN